MQIHFAEQEPWLDPAACDDLVPNILLLEVFKYPGAAHFFTDTDLDEYDETLAETVFERVRGFLAE